MLKLAHNWKVYDKCFYVRDRGVAKILNGFGYYWAQIAQKFNLVQICVFALLLNSVLHEDIGNIHG